MVQKKMVVCKNCNTPILKKAKVCPNCGVKNKKPFYKRGWFILLLIIVALITLISISSDDSETFDWNDFELSYLLPEPESNKGRLLTDTENNFSIYICKSSKDEYDTYVDECKNKGFTIESEKTDSNYTAYNEDGYKIALWYDEADKEYHIDLSAQEEMTELEWPSRGVGSLLPDPYESIGKIVRDESNYFSVIVGEMDKDDFKYYVEECEDEGFTVDYSKTDEYFSAKNKEGYSLTVKYTGFNTVEITLTKEENENETQTNENTSQKDEEVTKSDIKGLRPEFIEAMNSYEEFMDEYVEFMKKYNDSNGNDITLLADYADYMSKYAEFVDDFDKWNEEEMSDEELAYYLQVQSRVYQKLSEVE